MYCSLLHTTRIGDIYLEASADGLTAVQFLGHDSKKAIVDNPNEHIDLVKHELMQYFDFNLQEFSVSLDLNIGTTFQIEVWNAVKDIAFGHTASYLDISKHIGNEKAVRAVGAANGSNPIPIIIPCHRVIASNGNLQGYAYGLKMKQFLLAHENPLAFGVQQKLF